MGTRFEILLYGEGKGFLQAAGEEALDEIERLDHLLSAFRPDSAIHKVNTHAGREPVRVEPSVFCLLETCRNLWRETGGRFDITVGPLMHCWGFRGSRESPPGEEEVAAARERVGMQGVVLEAAMRTVFFEHEGMIVDLGGIGKGWAIDQAVSLLREAGVKSALIHGGTSTAYAIGAPPGEEGWLVAIRPPPAELLPAPQPVDKPFVQEVRLRDNALSVSGLAGRLMRSGDFLEGHVIDPLNGMPVRETLLAGVVSKSATTSDAWSTALLIGGPCLLNCLEGGLGLDYCLLMRKDGALLETPFPDSASS